MVYWGTFSISKISQLGSSYAFYSPKIRRPRICTLIQSRMLRSKAERENDGPGATHLTNEATKGLRNGNKELRTSHEQRTAADPRQNAIHDVILFKVETLYQNVRLLRLRPSRSRFDHETVEGHGSGDIHASRLNLFRCRVSQCIGP